MQLFFFFLFSCTIQGIFISSDITSHAISNNQPLDVLAQECVICYEPISTPEPPVFTCTHIDFHKLCITKARQTNQSKRPPIPLNCPLCRAKELPQNLTLENTLSAIYTIQTVQLAEFSSIIYGHVLSYAQIEQFMLSAIQQHIFSPIMKILVNQNSTYLWTIFNIVIMYADSRQDKRLNSAFIVLLNVAYDYPSKRQELINVHLKLIQRDMWSYSTFFFTHYDSTFEVFDIGQIFIASIKNNAPTTEMIQFTVMKFGFIKYSTLVEALNLCGELKRWDIVEYLSRMLVWRGENVSLDLTDFEMRYYDLMPNEILRKLLEYSIEPFELDEES